jgi:hypothetical protein
VRIASSRHGNLDAGDIKNGRQQIPDDQWMLPDFLAFRFRRSSHQWLSWQVVHDVECAAQREVNSPF